MNINHIIKDENINNDDIENHNNALCIIDHS